jgi:hypothetical protein
MATSESKLMTAGKIAEALSAPPAKVKQAIAALGLKPKAKKGACSYYGAESLPKIKAAIK